MSTTCSSSTAMARILPVVASLFAFALTLTWTELPAAAAPPEAGPEQEACQTRSVGDACTLPNNQLGTCANATCNRLDYSGGSPPKAIEEACIVCKAPGAQAHDGPPMLGGDGGASEAGSAGSADSGKQPDKEPPASASRCQIGERGSEPAGLALLAGLLLLAGRRRPRG